MTPARSLLVLALALSVARVASAQPALAERVDVDPLTAAISGRVTSETGGPLRGVEIRATSNGGEVQPIEPLWNGAGYLRNVVETVRVKAV